MRLRVQEITRLICAQMDVRIIKGVLSNNHIHMFVEISPKHSVSDVMRRFNLVHMIYLSWVQKIIDLIALTDLLVMKG